LAIKADDGTGPHHTGWDGEAAAVNGSGAWVHPNRWRKVARSNVAASALWSTGTLAPTEAPLTFADSTTAAAELEMRSSRISLACFFVRRFTLQLEINSRKTSDMREKQFPPSFRHASVIYEETIGECRPRKTADKSIYAR
jgi:hypothetical protein